jgi:hypothetical protein
MLVLMFVLVLVDGRLELVDEGLVLVGDDKVGWCWCRLVEEEVGVVS